ncbi:MAG: hypothetical protein IPP99_12300 [Chitinophagaceae bacterium]|nr:hypothetical protein [Chitinophagaceae bacterium]
MSVRIPVIKQGVRSERMIIKSWNRDHQGCTGWVTIVKNLGRIIKTEV